MRDIENLFDHLNQTFGGRILIGFYAMIPIVLLTVSLGVWAMSLLFGPVVFPFEMILITCFVLVVTMVVHTILHKRDSENQNLPRSQ